MHENRVHSISVRPIASLRAIHRQQRRTLYRGEPHCSRPLDTLSIISGLESYFAERSERGAGFILGDTILYLMLDYVRSVMAVVTTTWK